MVGDIYELIFWSQARISVLTSDMVLGKSLVPLSLSLPTCEMGTVLTPIPWTAIMEMLYGACNMLYGAYNYML